MLRTGSVFGKAYVADPGREYTLERYRSSESRYILKTKPRVRIVEDGKKRIDILWLGRRHAGFEAKACSYQAVVYGCDSPEANRMIPGGGDVFSARSFRERAPALVEGGEAEAAPRIVRPSRPPAKRLAVYDAAECAALAALAVPTRHSHYASTQQSPPRTVTQGASGELLVQTFQDARGDVDLVHSPARASSSRECVDFLRSIGVCGERS